MLGPYIHDIDPIITSVRGVHLWWYGLSYSLGFLNAYLFLRRNRARLGLSLPAVYDLTLFLAVGVLIGGRSLVVFNNEWSFYREHLSLMPAIWLGGLATHGLIVGGAAGVLAFCILFRKPFRPILDALAIAAALILGCGRIGNFIDGQIVGSLTNVPWAVKFPEAGGFRHPVVLYDGVKNFMLIPLLLWVRSRGVPPGRLAVLFIFLYAALRIPIDLLREYPITLLGLPTGQTFNIAMALLGAILLLRNWLRRPGTRVDAPSAPIDVPPGAGLRGRPRQAANAKRRGPVMLARGSLMHIARNAFVLVAAMAVLANAQDTLDAFLNWSRDQATTIGSAMRRVDNVGNRMSFRGLKTDRAISYKMRATWLTPEVIRATARLVQLNERMSPARARALVSEAEVAGDAIFLIELDPNEGSGVIPNDWTAVLQPKGLPRGDSGAATGTVVPKPRDVRALSGVFKRDYSYDIFWVVFPLHSDAGAPLFAPAVREAELVVTIQGREGIVSWPIPDYVRNRLSRTP